MPTDDLYTIRTRSPGPAGALPLTDEMLRTSPSGDIFGLTQSAGMGWKPEELWRKQFLILSTQGGLRAPDGSPIALGYHTGHWEIAELVRVAAEEIRDRGGIPFAAYCSDPCDGRTQGTTGMFDSLPYRNDAAIIFRRLARSLPTRRGVLGIATCDKGLPAMMMALAGLRDLACVIVPGGVTLPASDGEDAGAVQSLGARYSHNLVTLQEAAELGCRACASPGGGCQFLGTAATSQVVAEALGLALPHSALTPSGQPVWLDLARRSAAALMSLEESGATSKDIVTQSAIENAMMVHAAFGGSTNLLLHVPAIAHAAGLQRPTAQDWLAVNRRVARIVDALPNGPMHHPTVRVFLAGGVPEVMLHLRAMGVLHLDARSAAGHTWGDELDTWERSERRHRFRELLRSQDGVDPDDVIMAPDVAARRGLTSTVVFPHGNLAPGGSVIKATSIAPDVIDADGVYRHEGPVKVFFREPAAIAAIREGQIVAGDVLVLAGRGPMGSGMEETYQLTSALKFLPFGKHVALVTDARFSGVSTGACIGHVSPEALAGGPLGKLRDGDWVRIVIDRARLSGSVDFVRDGDDAFSPEEGALRLAARTAHPDLSPDPDLPPDTRLWAALQDVSGGSWGGCVFDEAAIIARLT